MTHDKPLDNTEDIVSHSEHEDTDVEEEIEQPTSGIQGQIIPDDHPDQIDADADLTNDYPDDSEYVDLIHLKIRSMEDLNLGRFKNLKGLVLRQNLLDSISDVKNINQDIEELDFYDNRIKHISSHLNGLIKLKNLDLSFNKIRNIKNIENLTELENLYFVQNKISEIVNLDNFTKLKNLELGGNRISKIENLDKLENLEELWLGKNKIPRFENLNPLRNLKILSIQSNRITKLEGLENLVNLEELYVSHNGIEKIEGLENNKKLTTLDITSNRITDLENLSHLTELTDLWASSNKISSFDQVEKELKDLKQLDTVYFEGNPLQLQNPTSYRRKLIMFLPQVQKIDATYVR
ncbi:hypothetical protein BN7_3294 [Wickerhamomyces ciferrii]|uniref:Protein phosphatase 1 regulatory subunit 7 n=1 Tax=Wickerhamomyces ciferrii (strain ATCC 14091 / BCRC 22168 / CBS 111 / JCM 3599 / NBRC 0793 / NRRL Y-1031 F-60-10) TaxID=1206466 RepID=K0KF29_WICCF|nr:uncharacterized protein BN7_3294 [Wickerhamomyces ciferrii]CCH43740.1 hypothetical protein BN7_3294 [Wickerhamomyces ciferrii]